MIRSVVAVIVIQLVILIDGCSGISHKPVLPDGSHRVSVNRIPPVPPSDGGDHER